MARLAGAGGAGAGRLDARYNGIIYKKDPHGCEDPALTVDDPTFAAIAEKFAPENSTLTQQALALICIRCAKPWALWLVSRRSISPP